MNQNYAKLVGHLGGPSVSWMRLLQSVAGAISSFCDVLSSGRVFGAMNSFCDVLPRGA